MNFKLTSILSAMFLITFSPKVCFSFWEVVSDFGLVYPMSAVDKQVTGVMQKFVDQSISANTYYKPANFEGASVPMKVLMKDLTDSYKFGLKTLYYHNTHSSDDESLDAFVDDCEGGACKI